MRRIHRTASGQHHHLVGQVSSTGPHFLPGEDPAAVGANRLHRCGCQIRSRLRLTHSDCRKVTSRSNFRQDPPALLLVAVRQQTRTYLTVGDPVRGHRGTGGKEFLGHHVAVQVAQAAPAILLRDGQAQKAGVAKSCTERFIPFG